MPLMLPLPLPLQPDAVADAAPVPAAAAALCFPSAVWASRTWCSCRMRCVELRFYIDLETGEPHVLQHGVSEEEVAEVLQRPGEDRPGREGSRVAIGKTAGGRYLRVIYVPDPDPESAFVITAYDLEGKPLAAYKRRRRRRKR